MSESLSFSPSGMHDPLIGARRMALYGLDADACHIVQDHQDYILSLMPEVLERFYTHLGRFPELDHFFNGSGHIEHIKKRQLIHWQRLTSAVFDDVYAQSVMQVGMAHFRVGISPRLYIACYSVILSQLCELINATYGMFFEDRRPDDAARLLLNLTRVLMYDMECAITVYVEENSTIFI